jgi:hypothetical protein
MQQAPRFQGNELISRILREMPLRQRVLGQVVQMREGVQGLSHLKFFQDTLVALLPKALVSRSKVEFSESMFLELLESFIIYYSMPLVGGKLMKPLFQKLLTVGASEPLKAPLLTRSIRGLPSDLPQTQLRRLLSGKAAIILSTLGLTVAGGEYVVNYAKNILTARFFKKDRFSDVVNLSQGTIRSNQPGQVEGKATQRIQQCLMVCAGIMGGALLLGRFGHKLPLEKIKGAIQKFDFNYSPKGKMGLSFSQMLLYMGLSVPAYLDAARDSLEQVEVASRLALVLPYLAFGHEALEKALKKCVAKKDPALLNEQGQVKTLDTIAKTAMAEAKQALGSNAKPAQLLKAAAQKMEKPLSAKNMLFGVPLAVGVLVTGLGVGLLSRFWTAYRFQKAVAETSGTLPGSLPPPAPSRFNSPTNVLQPKVAPNDASFRSSQPLPGLSRRPYPFYPSSAHSQIFPVPTRFSP